MDKFTCMQALTRVVESGSFAEAARRMGVSAPMVTKYIGHLEKTLGSRLLDRSTHSVTLTDVGQVYYQRCVQLLDDLREAEAEAGARSTIPSGTLRVSVSAKFGIAPLGRALLEYGNRHPDVRVEASTSAHSLDLLEERFDLAVRISSQLRTHLLTEKLATSRLVVCATPEYLKARGEPRSPEHLLEHNCLAFSESLPAVEQWRFAQAGRVSIIRVQGTLRSSNNELLRLAALQGQGIVLQPTFSVGEALKDGRLVQLLSDYDAGVLGLYVIYPNRKYRAAKVRSFVTTLAELWGQDAERDPFWEASTQA